MRWRWLINHLATGLGRLPHEVGEAMTLPEANALLDYWREYPPPHISMRMLAMAKAGFQPKESEDRPRHEPELQDASALLEMFSGTGGVISAL